MKYKKILSTSDPLYDKVKTRVVIHLDKYPQNPLTDWDQVFHLHSNIDAFCGDERKHPMPLEEILDEDGCGTGTYRPREGVIAFSVAAYIHGDIALSLGSGSHFPDQMWDVTRDAAYMWTTRERIEEMLAPWMDMYDKRLKRRRKAETEDEYMAYLRDVARGELGLFQKYMDGECYGYTTEERSEFKKVYPDGREEECAEYEGGEDSCWGFYQDDESKYFDLDAPKSYGDDVEWFADDDCSHLVGDGYEVPEFVVTKARPDGGRVFLAAYTKTRDGAMSMEWSPDKEAAIKFPSWWKVQSVAQDVIPKDEYDARKNCIEIDKLKEVS